MLDPVQESLWFYTAADYLVINAFLWRDTDALEECLELVWQNNLGMIREAEELGPEQRFPFPPEDSETLLRCYRRRTPEVLDAEGRRRMLERAVSDIVTLCRAMKPVEENALLYRNLHARCAFAGLAPGDELPLPGLTSTSRTGQRIDYGCQDFRTPAQILEIRLPAGFPALAGRISENEVLLPPMRYRVLSVETRDQTPLITLRPESLLALRDLLREAAEAARSSLRIPLDDSAWEALLNG